MVRGFDIPWLGGQYTIDSGSKTMVRGSKYHEYVNQNTMVRGFDIA